MEREQEKMESKILRNMVKRKYIYSYNTNEFKSDIFILDKQVKPIRCSYQEPF